MSHSANSERPGAASVLVRGLLFAYADENTPIFRDFEWTVGQGETWAVLGPSGCGKTTLLYLLAGLRQPAGGQVLVGGYPVPRPRASTGLILQDHGLLPWATVAENAALGLRIGHFYRGKRPSGDGPRPYPPDLPADEATRWLERLGIAQLAGHYPAQLSGGQRQRVAIARTLALRPELLLMDEPFSALDLVIRQSLQDLVAELQRELELTTIIVTHNVEEAAFLGRQILVLAQPPNHLAHVVENPGAGTAGYRDTEPYQNTVHVLQERLKDAE